MSIQCKQIKEVYFTRSPMEFFIDLPITTGKVMNRKKIIYENYPSRFFYNYNKM